MESWPEIDGQIFRGREKDLELCDYFKGLHTPRIFTIREQCNALGCYRAIFKEINTHGFFACPRNQEKCQFQEESVYDKRYGKLGEKSEFP